MSAAVPNLWANRRSSPGEGPRTAKSTKWVLTRRSAKKRMALRVSALFLCPKICAARSSMQEQYTPVALEAAMLGRLLWLAVTLLVPLGGRATAQDNVP